MTAFDDASPQSEDPKAGLGCTQCVLADRRDFVRGAAGAVIMALAAVGLSPDIATAMPVRWISGLLRHAGEARYPVPASDGVQIDRDNQVILVRWQNAVYAFNVSCPHQNTALRWDAADSRFQCPKHHSKYQPDGTFISGRATRNMDRLTLRREADTIVVDLDAMHKSNEDQAGWAAAVVRL